MARLLAFLSSTSRSSLGAARAAHACTRVLTVDEANRNAPVDEELLETFAHSAIESALTSFRGARVTLVAESVNLQWLMTQGGSQSPPPDCYAQLEGQLGHFFGDRSGDGWIRRWTNKTRDCYDDLGESPYHHDSSRPPITLLEDVFAHTDYVSTGERTLTRRGFTALIDVEFADAEPAFIDRGLGSCYYTIKAPAQFQGPNMMRHLNSFIRVNCGSRAMDSIELLVPFMGYIGGFFRVDVLARVPGFD